MKAEIYRPVFHNIGGMQRWAGINNLCEWYWLFSLQRKFPTQPRKMQFWKNNKTSCDDARSVGEFFQCFFLPNIEYMYQHPLSPTAICTMCL